MFETLKDLGVFQLKDLIDYKDGQLNKVLLEKNDNFRMALMAYDKDVVLPEHAACGDAILFALEGSATITYNNKEYQINKGENIRFERTIPHSIKANTRFKMALVVVI